jgi:hypothetical protein
MRIDSTRQILASSVRGRWIVGAVALGVAVISLLLLLAASSASAGSKYPWVEGSGDRVPLFDAPEFMDIDQPFHISHGWADDKLSSKYPKQSLYFMLSADGQLVEHTAISDCDPAWGLDVDCQLYLYDFPDGLRSLFPDAEEGTQVHFEGFWYGPCRFLAETTDLPEPFECPYDKWNPTVLGLHQVVEIQFGEPEPVPIVFVSFPSGSLVGNSFVTESSGFEYLAGGDIETGWIASEEISDSEGQVFFEEAAIGVTFGDVVGIRHVGAEQEATLQTWNLTFDLYDGDTASGSADPELNGNAVFVCWDNNLEGEANEGGCTDADIADGAWGATDLGLEPDWTAFIQLHDEDGDIQEVIYMP